ncbi:MAG: hypothetical protein K2N56_03470 [Oscillospiraceae bacterium]|nr:hypothetical protein [Oscillospiraceae bacterium]
MPVDFKECVNSDELLDLKVDAIAVPRMISDERIPKITRYVYRQADEKKIAALYTSNKGNAYIFGTDLMDGHDTGFPPTRMDFPNITVTSGCGLNVKYIFHVCVEPYIVYKPIAPYDPGLHEEYYDILPQDELFPPPGIDTEYVPPESEMDYTLTRCYETVLNCAKKRGVRSIAFFMLGAEDISCYPYPLAYHVAHTAPRKWLSQNTEPRPLTPGEEEQSPFLKLVKMNKEKRTKDYESAKARLEQSRAEIDIHIIEPPREFMQSTTLAKEIPDDPRIEYIKLENRLESEIKSSKKTREAFARDFILKCFNDAPISCNALNDMINYNPSKFKNGKIKSPHLHYVVAMAVGLRLEKYERFAFIRFAEYNDYPSSGFDFTVEKLIDSGIREFNELNDALIETDPAYDLTADVKRSKTTVDKTIKC